MTPEFRLAMMHAALFWPGVCISDGAFAVLRQVAKYKLAKKTMRARAKRGRA